MFPDQLQHIHDGHQQNHHQEQQQQHNIDNSTGVSPHTLAWSSVCAHNFNNTHNLFPNSNVDSSHLASASISTSTTTTTTTTPISSSLPCPADTDLDGLGWPLLDGSFDAASGGFGLLDAATEESIAAAVEQTLSESPPPSSMASMDTSYSSAAVSAAMASTASAAAAATSYSMLPLQYQQQQQQQRHTPIAAAAVNSSSGNDASSTFMAGVMQQQHQHQQHHKPVKGKPGRKRSHDPSDDDPDVALKRARNNIAAKKYRQKKIDRITELETEVADVRTERDELRVQLARVEAETTALRELLRLANVKSS